MNYNDKLGIGTVQFGMPYGISNKAGQTSPSEVTAIFNLARNQKIKLLDSASAYGNSEEVLGKNNLEGFNVISKFLPPLKGECISSQLDQSLLRLNLPSLYGYLAHGPLELQKHPEQWKELLDLKQKGKVNKIGFSLNHPEELEVLLNSGMIPDIVQAPFNYFDTRFKPQLIDLKKNGCEIHTRSTFLQGLFFLNPVVLPEFFGEVKEPIRKLQLQLKGNLAGGLLRYVLSQHFIDHVIIGIENVDQLHQNLSEIEFINDLPEKFDGNVSEKILMPSLWPKK